MAESPPAAEPSTNPGVGPSPVDSRLFGAYIALLRRHLSTPRATALALQDPHALVWQRLADLLAEHPESDLGPLLLRVHASAADAYPTLPERATRRPNAKTPARLLRKLGQVAGSNERAALCDWIACRLESPVSAFPAAQDAFADTLPDDATLVWRDAPPGLANPTPANVVLFGYAFCPTALAVLEIQIVEPFAGWIFAANSRAKHATQPGLVTFTQSSQLFEALKTRVLTGEGAKRDLPDRGNVVAYYERVRREQGENAPLDLEQLAVFQRIVDDIYRR